MRRFLLVLLMAGCVSAESPVDVSLAARVGPEPVMATWYAEVEDCLGGGGPGFYSVRWFSTPGMVHPDRDQRADGWWFEPHDIHFSPDVWAKIRKPENEQAAAYAKATAQHEMLHHATQLGYAVDHTDRYAACDPFRSWFRDGQLR